MLWHEPIGAWDWPSLRVAGTGALQRCVGTCAVADAPYALRPAARPRRPGSGTVRGHRAFMARGIRPRKYHQAHQLCSV